MLWLKNNIYYELIIAIQCAIEFASYFTNKKVFYFPGFWWVRIALCYIEFHLARIIFYIACGFLYNIILNELPYSSSGSPEKALADEIVFIFSLFAKYTCTQSAPLRLKLFSRLICWLETLPKQFPYNLFMFFHM